MPQIDWMLLNLVSEKVDEVADHFGCFETIISTNYLKNTTAHSKYSLCFKLVSVVFALVSSEQSCKKGRPLD